MPSLNAVTAHLRAWLEMNDLPVDDVIVTLELPDQKSVYRTEAVIKRELDAMTQYHVTGLTSGKTTLNGLGLTLRSRFFDKAGKCT